MRAELSTLIHLFDLNVVEQAEIADGIRIARLDPAWLAEASSFSSILQVVQRPEVKIGLASGSPTSCVSQAF